MLKKEKKDFKKYKNIDQAQTLRSWKLLPKLNKVYLIIFMIIIIGVFLSLFITNVFTDLGWWNGHFHINYYYRPSKPGNHPAYLDPYYTTPHDKWGFYGLNDSDPLWSKWNIRIIRQPKLFWTFTQFTWLTTFSVFTIVIVRLFKYQEAWPNKIKWMISHDVLYMITMLDTVVMIVFWSALFKNFDKSFPIDPILMNLGKTITILVHGLLPSLLLIYTLVFAIFDKDATILKKKHFITIGTIIIVLYMLYYVLIAFTWDDPYSSFTDLRNGVGWWQLILLSCLMEGVICGSYYLNNFIIQKYNKYYKSNKLRKQINAKSKKK